MIQEKQDPGLLPKGANVGPTIAFPNIDTGGNLQLWQAAFYVVLAPTTAQDGLG